MVQASSATDFLSTVGINTSVTMISSAYQNYAQMTNALAYLDIHQVRDTYDNPYTIAEFPLMARQLGLKFDFFIALGSAWPEWQMEQIRNNPTIVSYVEGYNESDSWWQSFHGATGADATAAVQQYIYHEVKTNPALSGVGVIQATFASPGGFAAYGDHGTSTDYASTHTYSGTGNNPGSGFETVMIDQAQSASPGKPTITTEAGFHTTAGNVHGVSQLVQAKYTLNLLFEQAKLGVKLTYLWGLVDHYADPGNTNSENHYGLFNNDWTPKIAAIALHNTLAIMADPGTGRVSPTSLDYALDGLPASVQTSLFQKSDGTFVLAVWNDVRLSGPTVQADIAVAPIATTLRLGQSFAHLAVFDPLRGTTAVGGAANTDTLSLQLPDHPLLIELSQDPNFDPGGGAIEAPDRIITNPLASVQIDGLSIAGSAADFVTVHLHAGKSGLSVLDTNGHLLANAAADITLAGTLATVNAELATLNYTGDASLGSDAISVSYLAGSGAAATRTIAVAVLAGTPASNSGGPALSVPATFSGITGAAVLLPRLTLSDAYAATHAGPITLAVRANTGTLRLPDGVGNVSGNGTNSLGLSGSFAELRAALSSLSYTAPVTGAADTITYFVADQEGFTAQQSTAVTIGPAAAVNTAEIPPAVVTPIVPVTLSASIDGAAAASGGTSTVFRFFDSRNGTQFLTGSTAERDAILATRPDLVPEGVGIGALAQPAGDANAVAVFRFFDTGSGTHFFTSSAAERDGLQNGRADLKYEGVSFYEHAAQVGDDMAVYRFFNAENGTHFYTASASERGSILATRPDLIAEGIAFYAPTS